MSPSSTFAAGAFALGMIVALGLCAGAAPADYHASQVQARKLKFLADRVDWWKSAGYPLIQYEGREWKFDEIEPCWAGAHAALVLKRDKGEIEKANWFFANAPIDWDCDPDMRVCELLHSYYAFKDDKDFTQAAKDRLLAIFDTREAPRRIEKSTWNFRATENHAMMFHVWRLLTSQMKGDTEEATTVANYIADYIAEHARKGWREFYSPCYVEKQIGCMVMLREWANDERLRKLADLMLDNLFAEQAVLNLDGMMCGPCMRAYGAEIVAGDGEINHNNRRDRMRSGLYSAAYIVFGDAQPHFYGVLGSFCLASSGYVPSELTTRLALAREERGCYEIRARKPGKWLGKSIERNKGVPGDDAFCTRVYCYATPDFVLGASQEVTRKYGMTDARMTSMFNALVVRGSTRKTVFFECGTEQLDLFQHKNVLVGKSDFAEAYVATHELGQPVEKSGWIFLKDPNAFVAMRPVQGGYEWRKIFSASVFGEYLGFRDPTSPFVIEVARPSDYGSDFDLFMEDILDNKLRVTKSGGLVYESGSRGKSGPSAERFTVELRPHSLPKLNGKVVDLQSYPTIESPFVNSAWDSGVIQVTFGGETLTLDFNKVERRLEKH